MALLVLLVPVGSQSGGDVPSGDLRHDVAPEKGAVDQPHRLRVPVELGFLGSETQKSVNIWNIPDPRIILCLTG